MNILGNLKSAGTRILSGWRSNSSEPPKRGVFEFLQAYETMPWVHSIATRIGGHLGITQWLLRRSDTGAEVTSNLALDVLRRPNPILSAYDLWSLVSMTRDIVGEAFLVKERNGLGAPVAYWPIPPHWIQDTPTVDRPYYSVRFNNLQWQVPASEMVDLPRPSPVNPYARGSGLVQSQGDELEIIEYSSKHAKSIFYNRAMPEVVVMDPDASDIDVARHEQHWRQRLEGFFRAFKPYFTNRDLKFWQPNQMNLENLTLVPLRKNERDFILQTWGIPPEQFGIVENSNRATIEGSDYVMEKRVIEPRRIALAAQLTLKMLPDFDPRLVLGFVSTVPEDRDREIKVMQAAPWAFVEEEWRARAGYDKPAPAGGVRVVPLNSFATDDLTDQEQRPKAAPAKPAGEPADEPPAPEPES